MSELMRLEELVIELLGLVLALPRPSKPGVGELPDPDRDDEAAVNKDYY
jgi:hypothetical protein